MRIVGRVLEDTMEIDNNENIEKTIVVKSNRKGRKTKETKKKKNNKEELNNNEGSDIEVIYQDHMREEIINQNFKEVVNTLYKNGVLEFEYVIDNKSYFLTQEQAKDKKMLAVINGASAIFIHYKTHNNGPTYKLVAEQIAVVCKTYPFGLTRGQFNILYEEYGKNTPLAQMHLSEDKYEYYVLCQVCYKKFLEILSKYQELHDNHLVKDFKEQIELTPVHETKKDYSKILEAKDELRQKSEYRNGITNIKQATEKACSTTIENFNKNEMESTHKKRYKKKGLEVLPKNHTKCTMLYPAIYNFYTNMRDRNRVLSIEEREKAELFVDIKATVNFIKNLKVLTRKFDKDSEAPEDLKRRRLGECLEWESKRRELDSITIYEDLLRRLLKEFVYHKDGYFSLNDLRYVLRNYYTYVRDSRFYNRANKLDEKFSNVLWSDDKIWKEEWISIDEVDSISLVEKVNDKGEWKESEREINDKMKLLINRAEIQLKNYQNHHYVEKGIRYNFLQTFFIFMFFLANGVEAKIYRNDDDKVVIEGNNAYYRELVNQSNNYYYYGKYYDKEGELQEGIYRLDEWSFEYLISLEEMSMTVNGKLEDLEGLDYDIFSALETIYDEFSNKLDSIKDNTGILTTENLNKLATREDVTWSTNTIIDQITSLKDNLREGISDVTSNIDNKINNLNQNIIDKVNEVGGNIDFKSNEAIGILDEIKQKENDINLETKYLNDKFNDYNNKYDENIKKFDNNYETLKDKIAELEENLLESTDNIKENISEEFKIKINKVIDELYDYKENFKILNNTIMELLIEIKNILVGSFKECKITFMNEDDNEICYWVETTEQSCQFNNNIIYSIELPGRKCIEKENQIRENTQTYVTRGDWLGYGVTILGIIVNVTTSTVVITLLIIKIVRTRKVKKVIRSKRTNNNNKRSKQKEIIESYDNSSEVSVDDDPNIEANYL